MLIDTIQVIEYEGLASFTFDKHLWPRVSVQKHSVCQNHNRQEDGLLGGWWSRVSHGIRAPTKTLQCSTSSSDRYRHVVFLKRLTSKMTQRSDICSSIAVDKPLLLRKDKSSVE
jgi:hypothetical protein